MATKFVPFPLSQLLGGGITSVAERKRDVLTHLTHCNPRICSDPGTSTGGNHAVI